MLKRLKF